MEFLPDDEQLEERRRQGRGLTRPELALLLAYGKIALNHALADRRQRRGSLSGARAAALFSARRCAVAMPSASSTTVCAAQIIITAITNSLVNRVGPALLMQCARADRTRMPVAVARAYTIARDSADLRALWADIEALDGRVRAADQYQALLRHQPLICAI